MRFGVDVDGPGTSTADVVGSPPSAVGGPASIRSRAVWSAYLLFLLIGSFVIYGGSTANSFQGDDVHEILRGVSDPPRSFFTGATTFRPATALSYWLNHLVGGTDARSYHVVNVFLHALVACGVAVMVRQGLRLASVRLGSHLGLNSGAAVEGDRGPWRMLPYATGVTFLVMPNHMEPVRWISARSDQLVALAALVTICAYLTQRLGSSQRRVVTANVLGLVSFAVALLSKESAVIVPFVLVALDRALGARRNGVRPPLGDTLTSVSGHAVLLAVYLARRAWAGDGLAGYGSPLSDGGQWWRLPVDHLILVVRSFLPSMPMWAWLVAVGASAIAVGLVVRVARRSGPGAIPLPRDVGRLGVALALSLALSVVPALAVGVALRGSHGDRVVYLPSVFAAGLIAIGLLALLERFGRVVLLPMLVLLALVVVSHIDSAARWSEAATLAGSIHDEMAGREVDGAVYVLNAPETIRGVIATRNSFGGIDEFVGNDDAPPIHVVASVHLDDPDQRFELVSGAGPGHWELSLIDQGPADTLVRGRHQDDGPWQVADSESDGLRIQLPAGTRSGHLVYLTGGELRWHDLSDSLGGSD